NITKQAVDPEERLMSTQPSTSAKATAANPSDKASPVASNDAEGRHWSDPKRYLWLMSPALPGVGLAALAGYAIAPKKLKALAWTGPALIHGIIPALDRLVGEDASNP